MTHVDFFLTAFDKWHEQHPEVKGNVLDVGCRDRVLTNPLTQRGFTWYGVDKEPRDKNDNRILAAKMESLDVNNSFVGHFDLVVCCHSFEHCERPIDALREFMRVLKPGGYLFIGGPNPCHRQIGGGDPDHIFVLNEMQLHKLLIYTGYDQVVVFTHLEQQEQDHTICATGRKPL